MTKRDRRTHLMQDIKKDVKSDLRAAQKLRAPWWVILLGGVVSLPVYWLFDHLGRDNLGFPAVVAVTALAFTAVVKWNLSRQPRFWATMTVLAALHALLVAFLPWGTRWIPATVVAGVCSLDVYVMIVILDVVGGIASR